ncbi:DUF2304 domain-containing protein [Actinomycetaceae bacterium MB13-C1-2]|nr:DUF2304 domain-containing protein [Actinomycetaceae bacterium MB13-C1-2]
MNYWLIKGILIISLMVLMYFLFRPARSDSSLALRRIGMFLIMVAAVFAIIFPGLFNRFAQSIGVMSGTNLLVYMLVIVILAQMASSYRKDMASQQKLTTLARKIALMEEENSGAEPRNLGNLPDESGVEGNPGPYKPQDGE